MKKLLSSFIIIAALSLVACNNEKKADKIETSTEKVEDATTPAQSTATTMMVAKAHVCGANCTDGNHAYAHGDVGHTCTEACGAAHVCGSSCKDGNHIYGHGEVGHTCTDACTTL